MTYNPDIQRIINSQMSITFQTLSVLSQTLTLLSAQQTSLSRMFTIMQREQRNNETPITLSFNSVTLSDLYDSSNNEIPNSLNENEIHPILQNILNMINNTNDVSNNNPVFDISMVTQTLLFSQLENPTTSICPISLEHFQPNDEILKINRCSHYFKKSPLEYWFRLSKMCPVCRRDVTNIDSPL